MDSKLLFLGAVTGFTIYLGLPLARLRGVSMQLRGFLNALSVGILVFLLIEIVGKLLESIEHGVVAVSRGSAPAGEAIHAVLFFFGFGLGLMLMVYFESKFIPRDDAAELTDERARRFALMIAAGIGLHNFGEGLAIGQLYAAGAIPLAMTLVIGFGLHNATEGFGIAAPIAGRPVTIKFLALAGLIGGGPTFVGTILGSLWVSRVVETFVLALAGGSILYIVGELLHIGRRQIVHGRVMAGLLVGFFLAYGTELYIQVAAGGELYAEELVYNYPAERPSVEMGAAIYAEHCSTCHGDKGDGKGPKAAELDVSPRDFTDRAWAAGEADAEWFDVISFGRPHTPMEGWHQKLSESERWDVIAYVRHFVYNLNSPADPQSGETSR
jgi:ZIP family zinc transporter